MADVPRAADLPIGSVVAGTIGDLPIVFLKRSRAMWRDTTGSSVGNNDVDGVIDGGAIVLRHGYGEDG